MQQGSLYNSYHKVYIVAVNYRAETERPLFWSLWTLSLHKVFGSLFCTDEEATDEELDTDFSEGESVENGLKEADQGGDVTEVTDEATPSPQQLHMAAVGDGGEEEVFAYCNPKHMLNKRCT